MGNVYDFPGSNNKNDNDLSVASIVDTFRTIADALEEMDDEAFEYGDSGFSEELESAVMSTTPTKFLIALAGSDGQHIFIASDNYDTDHVEGLIGGLIDTYGLEYE